MRYIDLIIFSIYTTYANLIWGTERVNLGPLPNDITMISSIPRSGLRYHGGALSQIRIKDYNFELDDIVIAVDDDNYVTGSANEVNSGINDTLNTGSLTFAILGTNSSKSVKDPQRFFFRKKNTSDWTTLSLDSTVVYWKFDHSSLQWSTEEPTEAFPGYNNIVGRLGQNAPVMYDFPRCACNYLTFDESNYYHLSDAGNFSNQTNGRMNFLFENCTFLPEYGKCMSYFDLSQTYGRCAKHHDSTSVLDVSQISSCEVAKKPLRCYSTDSTTNTSKLLSYRNDGSDLKLADILTLVYRSLDTRFTDPTVWDISMMNFCADWNNDNRIRLDDILEVLYFSLGTKNRLYPNNAEVHFR